MRRLSLLRFSSLSLVVCFASMAADATRTYDFPIYKNKPAGRQMSGQHAPASTPALSPEDALKKFTVPDGFEVRLFASEPEVANPVGMTWDERGRLWVLELYEYPLGAKPGEKPRDRIKIFEDTDADGRSDKITVFADGLNLATGILVGNGGVFVGQAPHLLFLEDTNGDDKADKTTILKTGFGLEDRHELLNGFTWGPDGYLYMTHGVFTHSKVKDPDKPDDDGVIVTAAVARYHPRTKKFEVFAEGTSNPWGVDFDRYGNAYVSACVIEHLFHMAPGGIFARQAGTPPNAYAYIDGLPGKGLPSIVDHRHHMAAYSGVHVYEGDQYPDDYRGTIMMGNIHANAVHQDRLAPNGSSFKASFVRDFVRADDGWFMPVSEQVGPDGCLWIMDWYDKYPCYQNANADPEGVDREYGRIWRVVYAGGQKGKAVPSRPQKDMNLAKLSGAELVKLLEHKNAWHRRTAQRVLSERRYSETRSALGKLLQDGATLDARLAALWTLHTAGFLDEATIERHAADKEPAIRAWLARLTAERGDTSNEALVRLETLAADPDPTVRFAVAVAARQYASGSLTVNTPVPERMRGVDIAPVLATLVLSSADAKDPLIPYMIWMAAEPFISRNPEDALSWMLDNGPRALPLSAELVRKTMRRLCDMRDPAMITTAVEFTSAAAGVSAEITVAALDGLLEGQKGNALLPTKSPGEFIGKLRAASNPGVVERAQRLGALWGDASSLAAILAKARDSKASDSDRIKAIQVARQMKTDAARDAMIELVTGKPSDAVAVEAIRALGELGGDNTGEELLKHWRTFSVATRNATAEALASRRRWSLPFITALEKREISSSEIPAAVIRSLVQSKDADVKDRANSVIGRVRDLDADKRKVIAEKRKVVVEGAVDLAAGHEIARKTCLNCHKLHGEGAEVGPDLTGVGRSTLDALLANVIDPNQIIGKGYENVEIETKDGRSVSGRLVEDTDARVKLLAAGPKEEIVAKSDVETMRVSQVSVMPEGLEAMPDADFRNLIWYILNPPQDNRPMTPELRKELIGEARPAASVAPADGESVALWNPEWRVTAPSFEGSPAKLPEYAGRKNVLMTHPFDMEKGSALERILEVPSGRRTSLSVSVASHEQGDWELRAFANGKLLHKEIISTKGASWKAVRIDLSALAGQSVVLRLENFANNWNWEFGYWSDLRIEAPTVVTQATRR